MRDNNS